MKLPVTFLDRVDWVECVGRAILVEKRDNIPLLPKLPTCFPFMSFAQLLSTPAQIVHSGGLFSLHNFSRTAVSNQL